MKKQYERIWALIFCTPFVLGAIGLMMTGLGVKDALFTGLMMYAINYTDQPANALIEIARWGAAAVTMGSAIVLLTRRGRSWAAWIRTRLTDTVAVFGDDELVETLREAGEHVLCLKEGERLLSARRYVLAGEEQESLQYYTEHRELLEGHRVYMRCESIRAQQVNVDACRGLKLYSPEETGARVFWQQAWAHIPSGSKNLRFAIIGFDELGKQVLLHGLQSNIFFPEQAFEYHVYGSDGEFERTYTELSAIGDRVVFHSEPWKASLDAIHADRVLICAQKDALRTVTDALFLLRDIEPDILTDISEQLQLVDGIDRCRVFEWKREAQRPGNLFRDETLVLAKQINLSYAQRYASEPVLSAEEEWKKLDAFTRYSNVSTADYHLIRLQMLKDMGITDPASLTAEQLEMLSCLEHVRWERFHYLNNWRYWEDPEGGRRKDRRRRLHADLVPYALLAESEKEKDRENVRFLLGI